MKIKDFDLYPAVQKVIARSPNASKNSDGRVKKCSYWSDRRSVIFSFFIFIYLFIIIIYFFCVESATPYNPFQNLK